MDVNPEAGKQISETETRPKVLYRAFSVDPRKLSPDFFNKPLMPGRVNKDDPTKIGDGNELGVYMSTNRIMSETAYASTNIPGLSIKTEKFNDRGVITDLVEVPVCGVILEIDTKGLDIRKPKIRPELQGVYNNGFDGDEWIADRIPPENYKVIRLKLSTHPNDARKFLVDIDNTNSESLPNGIVQIQKEFNSRYEKAQSFSNFIESLTPQDRRNQFIVSRKWQELQK